MPTNASSDLPDEAGARLIEQIIELWLRPALESRRLGKQPEDVDRALVVFRPGHEPDVLIDGEAAMIVQAKSTRAIEAGERVTEADLESIKALRPHGIDPDAGWIGFVRFKRNYTIAFDFRRNRTKIQRIVDLAADYAAAAQLAARAGRRGPALDNLHSAAELAAVAQISLTHDKPPGSHRKRLQLFETWVEFGNAPSDHGRTLRELAKHRASARYAAKTLRLSDADLEWYIGQVTDMVEHARKMVTGWFGS